MAIHVAYVKPTLVDIDGNVVDKNNPATTLQQVIDAHATEMRVVPDLDIPNTIDAPTIDDYLALENGAGFTLQSMTNTTIVTST